MKTPTKVLSALMFAMVLGASAFSAVAAADSMEGGRAFQGIRGEGECMQQGPKGEGMEAHAEHFEEVKQAVENSDYGAWITLMSDADHPRAEHMLGVITEDNFSLLGDMMEARMDGDREAARAIAEELGLKGPKHMQR